MPPRRQLRPHAAMRLLFRGSIFLWTVSPFAGFAAPPAHNATPQVLHTIAQIYTMSKAAAARPHPVSLDAVVTYSDGAWGMLFVQDATGNTFLDVPHGSPTYQPGDRLHVDAVALMQNGTVEIKKITVRLLGYGAPPVPVAASVPDLESGADISGWVVTQGVLHPCDGPAARVCYRLFAGKRMLYISVRQATETAAQKLVGAVVRVRGVVVSHFNQEGKRETAQLFAGSLNDFEVLSPPLPPNSPPTPIGDIAPENADESIVLPVRIHGRVLWQYHDRAMVRDGTGSIFVRFVAPAFPQIGDTVDVLGFPAHGEWGLELSDAQWHLFMNPMNNVGFAPLHVTGEDAFSSSSLGRRVQLTASLIGQSNLPASTVYHLRGNGRSFDAICLNVDKTGQAPEIPRGADVEVTGIAWTRAASGGSPAAFAILLQSPMDIAVRSKDNWLTWQRALGILSLIAVCMLIPLLWVKQLRRTVQKQTAIIHQNYASKLELEARFRRVIERNLAAVYTMDDRGVIIECNAAFAHMLGMESREELIGRQSSDFEAEPGQASRLKQALQEGMLSNWETSMRRSDGGIVHLLMNVTPVDAAEGTVYETTAIDITQLRQNQAELQKAKDAAVFDSLNDALTGLPNRRYLRDNLPLLLAKAKARHEVVALLFVDLDGFKMVNDSLGHAMGDALLVQVASCLRTRVRHGDILARLGGDEFMVILSNIQDVQTAVLVAESLRKAVSQSQSVGGHLLTVGASIGISIFPGDTANADDLIHHADCAMYAAKRAGKNRIARYTPEMGGFARARLMLENHLRGAVERNEIFLQYQPEFELAGQRLVRFEALARWTHPELGEVEPLKFIPVAEETGLIHELGLYLLEHACAEAVRWQEKTRIQLAVNISALQFHHPGFVEQVFGVLHRTGLDPHLLQIEFTESVMLSHSPDTKTIMHRLGDAGIQLAVDDFGTGYSNLSYLPELPFDYLKIDGSFVRHLDTRPSATTMMRTLIMMGHNFGMRVVVEGIESLVQLEHVRACGADEVQGYYMGRPTGDPMQALLAEASLL